VEEDPGMTREESHADMRALGRRLYRIRKLLRDCPEAVAKLRSGEFKSVTAAEKWARGEEPYKPRKQVSPLEKVKGLVRNLSAANKSELRKWLEEEEVG
jgi:hypothetical protein